ncbi:SGNH/GDSL hydrolase family protein [Streptococcus agalactiae]|nr:SGNH/GDSL hydrolase family protein [Streptococcus agalactiae]
MIIPKSNPKLTKKDFLTKKVIPLNYVALGDSLTEGVGDTTSQGGFVPLLSESLHNRYSYQVTSVNYGVSGNTSQQILKRMTTDPQIEKDLEKADLLTLTVGGNDVLAVIRKELSHLSLNSFEKPAEAYKERLKEILAKARQDNPKLPIYVLGIYNPFYLNFPQLTKMQTVIDNWNKATKEVVDASENVYFVPINDRLYKGINGKEGITESSNSQASITNDALFTGDHFHPNNIGYQIMSNAVMEKINETKKNWP